MPKPLHRFQALLWEKPHRVWVGVWVWRTAREMRESCGRAPVRYAALTYQFRRKRGQVCQMHFCKYYLDVDTIAHECVHAGLHIARQFDICTEEEEEAVAQITEHLVTQIRENLAHLL